MALVSCSSDDDSELRNVCDYIITKYYTSVDVPHQNPFSASYRCNTISYDRNGNIRHFCRKFRITDSRQFELLGDFESDVLVVKGGI
jgi:hypothetical protein